MHLPALDVAIGGLQVSLLEPAEFLPLAPEAVEQVSAIFSDVTIFIGRMRDDQYEALSQHIHRAMSSIESLLRLVDGSQRLVDTPTYLLMFGEQLFHSNDQSVNQPARRLLREKVVAIREILETMKLHALSSGYNSQFRQHPAV